MHAIVVTMSIDPQRNDEVARHLSEDIVSWAKSKPGFVSGQWFLDSGTSTGYGIVVFDSQVNAEAAAQDPRSFPDDAARAWNIEQVTCCEQVASA